MRRRKAENAGANELMWPVVFILAILAPHSEDYIEKIRGDVQEVQSRYFLNETDKLKS